jgi:hypothetical protein
VIPLILGVRPTKKAADDEILQRMLAVLGSDLLKLRIEPC